MFEFCKLFVFKSIAFDLVHLRKFRVLAVSTPELCLELLNLLPHLSILVLARRAGSISRLGLGFQGLGLGFLHWLAFHGLHGRHGCQGRCSEGSIRGRCREAVSEGLEPEMLQCIARPRINHDKLHVI